MENFVKNKLESGRAVLGTWAAIPSTVTADILASSGLDFVIIDAEHGPISFETAQQMAIACESRKVSPLMRVAELIEGDILKALDIGMHGIQIPNINSKSDVETLVKYAKYPPVGNRGYSPFTRAGGYSRANSYYTTQANSETLVGINVEGLEAIKDIEKILDVPELDIVFVGLFDLSKALGVPGQVDNPKVLDHLEQLVKKIRAAGKYPGTIAISEERMSQMLDMGILYLLYLVDCEMLRSTYAQKVEFFQKISPKV